MNRTDIPPYLATQDYLWNGMCSEELINTKVFLFSDFAARALNYLKSPGIKAKGFNYDATSSLPCTWKCSDESVFGIDLIVYGLTAKFPFNKGLIGGKYNAGSVGAAVHHGFGNVDFGGSHVGYVKDRPDDNFGYIWREAHNDYSSDCGYLMGVLKPFKKRYDELNKLISFNKEDENIFVSFPFYMLESSKQDSSIKMILRDELFNDNNYVITDGMIKRMVSKQVISRMDPETLNKLSSGLKISGKKVLKPEFFEIFDINAKLDEESNVQEGILAYMKYILSSSVLSYSVKAALINTGLEQALLRKTVSLEQYRYISFASFAGLIIDVYDPTVKNFINLYMPLELSLKAKGYTDVTVVEPAQLQEQILAQSPVEMQNKIAENTGICGTAEVLDDFSF